jgi:hypothetical protein
MGLQWVNLRHQPFGYWRINSSPRTRGDIEGFKPFRDGFMGPRHHVLILGVQLPIWKNLPHVTYWLLPLAVGLPLIIRALTSHPFRRLGDPT